MGVPRGGLLVDVAKPTVRLFEARLDAVGELQPVQQVTVMPRASGHLEQLTVDRSDQVRRGQLLAEVDDSNLVQQIQRAESAIAVARAGVLREQATLENLQAQLKRSQDLDAQGLISRQVLEEQESRVRTAHASLELSKAQVEQAEGSVRELRLQQEQTRVYSPLDGFVGERFVDPGTLVNSNTQLISIVDISRVKVVVALPETMLPEIREGLAAQISVDAYPNRVIRGTIRRISPVLRSETRSADVEIEAPNPSGELRPGMFARIRIEGGEARSSLSIPRSALLTRGDQQGVFLVGDASAVRFQAVTIGRIDGNFVEITSGITADSPIVISGAQSLNEGDLVRLSGDSGQRAGQPEPSADRPAGDRPSGGGRNP